MSDFDIEISSDEDEDFVTNSNIVGNMEGNPVSTARNTQHDKTEGEDDEIENTIVTEGLCLLNVLREGTSENMVCSSIQNFIDTSLNDLQNDWRGKIYLKVHIGDFKLHKTNIINHIGKAYQHQKTPTFYFCRETYPIAGGFKGNGFKKLVDDIQRASITTGGFQVTRSGTHRYKNDMKGSYILKCNRCQLYKGDISYNSTKQFRKLSFHNDRKNNRTGKETRHPRKGKTQLPLTRSHRCPFFMLLKFSKRGFHIINGRGNPMHKFHYKHGGHQDLIPGKLIEESSKKVIQDLANADASLGVIQNVQHHQTGRYFNRSTLFHIRGLCGVISHLEEDYKDCSSTDIMIKFLESRKYDYVMLIHCPQMSEIFQQARQIGVTQEPSVVVNFPHHEQGDADRFVTERRRTQNVGDNQQFMMGFAWTIPSEKVMFSLFPNVVYVDATMDTNSEGRPLLSLVGKDTCSKTFTILRVLLPNQQLWVFRWIFCVLLPKVYSNDLLSQIKIIVTDGDAQESSQIDNAIDLFSPQVKRVRCGWHIVHQGWNRLIGKPSYLHKKHIQQFKHFKTVCQSWIYSFMKFAYCETQDEYLLSKQLFFKYLESPRISEGAIKMVVLQVMAWFKNNVEVHENHYCFWKRKDTFHLGEYSNSSIEGTHNGMKYNAAKVGPSYSLHRTCAILTKNAERKEQERMSKHTKEFLSLRTYDKSQLYDKVIEYAKVSCENAEEESCKYECLKIKNFEWLVRRSLEKYPYEHLNEIPRFIRVRKVSYLDGKLICNCPTGKVWNLLCPHVIHVAKVCDRNYSFCQNDISCVWWKSYYEIGLQAIGTSALKVQLSNLFHILKRKHNTGISIPIQKISAVPIKTGRIPVEYQYNLESPKCVNYPNEVLKKNNDLGAGNMRLETNIDNGDTIQSESDEDEIYQIFDSYEQQHKVIEEDATNNSPIENPYAYLKSSFTEMTSLMKGNLSLNEIREVKDYMDGICNKIIRIKQNNKPKGKIVSSNVPFETKHKSHGTKYF